MVKIPGPLPVPDPIQHIESFLIMAGIDIIGRSAKMAVRFTLVGILSLTAVTGAAKASETAETREGRKADKGA